MFTCFSPVTIFVFYYLMWDMMAYVFCAYYLHSALDEFCHLEKL